MPHKPSVIKCQKCGFVSNIIGDTCAECGSRLEKVCGDCGFGNAVEKNYCDQCGALLALKPRSDTTQRRSRGSRRSVPGPKASWRIFNLPGQDAPGRDQDRERPQTGGGPSGGVEMESILDAAEARNISFRDRKPQERREERAPDQPAPKRSAVPPLPSSPKSRRTWVVLGLLMAAGLSILAYRAAVPHIPRLALKAAAEDYLENLSSGRYEAAYSLLSANSKASCSMQDFTAYNRRHYGSRPPWKFAKIEVFAISAEAAVVKYQLKEGDAPWRADYISFVREHDRWSRPYIWMLMDPIDDAISRQDYAQALFLAQRLYLTDPMNPVTSGYLCLAEFYMGLYDKSAESCSRTVSSAGTYPAGFTPEEIFWYRVYYADSLRFTGRTEDAKAEYDDLLGSGALTGTERCPLLLGRADAFVRLKRYEPALNDMLKADGECGGDANRPEVTRRMRFMNGDARAEAVAFAKSSRPAPGRPSFEDARKTALEESAAALGPRKARFAPKDVWVAAHIAGPEYRVIVRQETPASRSKPAEVAEVYAFIVNLWTGAIKLDQPARSRSEDQGD